MYLAERYEQLRDKATFVKEAFLDLPIKRALSEHQLQAHWFAGDFGREFTTTDGRAVRIVQFGVWNREAGPDFAEAAVSFDDGEPIKGDLEMDPQERDWEAHGHSENPAYDQVILHVFFGESTVDFFTRTSSHQFVPQVKLSMDLLTNPPLPLPGVFPGKCMQPLSSMPEEKVREVLLGAAHYRLQKKAAALCRLSEIHGPDEALYQAIATALGYKSNKLPFTLLAQRLPLRLLRKAGEDAEALLFGVAGFLNQKDLRFFDSDARGYLRGLWEKWWPRRAEFDKLEIPKSLWRMSGQRPINHPHRRLAALAQVVRHWTRLRALRDKCDPEKLTTYFTRLESEYWGFHYTLTSAAVKKPMALIGENRVSDMLANIFFPLAVTRDSLRWTGFKNLKVPNTNRRAETAAQRLFGNAPIKAALLKSAAIQQGLLQVYEDFCQRDASDCLRCVFPKQVVEW